MILRLEHPRIVRHHPAIAQQQDDMRQAGFPAGAALARETHDAPVRIAGGVIDDDRRDAGIPQPHHFGRETRHGRFHHGILVTLRHGARLCGLAALVTLASPGRADPIIHYAPAENLEKIDVAAIDDATTSIDMAAYVLTDHAVIDALREAAERGVAVRIYRGREDDERYPPSAAYKAMKATPGVTIRVKRTRVLMHLKSYAIDGRLLRTGAANFSASGLKQQDNDLVLVESPAAAQRFEADFARIWAEGDPEP